MSALDPLPDDPENDGLLKASTRVQRNISHSEDVIPSDEDTDYDIYTDKPPKDGQIPSSNQAKSPKNRSKKPKKQKSQYAPLEEGRKQKKKVIILCLVIWCILIAALIVFLVYYFDDKIITKEPWIIRTAPPTDAPTYIPTNFPTKAPSFNPTNLPSFNPTNLPSFNPTNLPSFNPTNFPSLTPTQTPTSYPTKPPSINPTVSPSFNPSIYPTTSPSNNPSIYPTKDPSLTPTQTPSSTPTQTPSFNPTQTPSSHPTGIPSLTPTIYPTLGPTLNPSFNPTNTPSSNPSITPSNNPSISPSKAPSNDPTQTPTNNPSIAPSKIPTNTPSINPSIAPSETPTKTPSNDPSVAPTNNPSITPTKSPSNNPSIPPTRNPTQSPITRILQIGNTIIDQGITMTFPQNAFPDSILEISITSPSTAIKSIYDDTTSGFQAISLDGITNNAFHFVVEYDPLSTANIVYTTIIPIPSDLISLCPVDYGYEIFTLIQQTGFGNDTFSIFVLFESTYDDTQKTLTTELFPEMFKDRNADIILSCTPGTNLAPIRRRRLLQNPNYATECKITPIKCPIDGGRCIIIKGFDRKHYGIDYQTQTTNILAAADGVIERSASSVAYGNIVIIRHDDDSATVYGELAEVSAVVGNNVVQGDVIGISGTTHLHFEYIPNGKLYATKKRADPKNCIPDNLPTRSPLHSAEPSKSPLVPPNTHNPSPSPSRSPLVPPRTHSPSPSPTAAPLYLPQGSITVRDSGKLADDSFAIYIDHKYKVCETEIGALNTCAISFLRPGLHTLTLEVVVAPDGFGTFNIQLNNGWKFTDGNTTKDAIDDLNNFIPPEGWKGSWNFTVPITAPPTRSPTPPI